MATAAGWRGWPEGEGPVEGERVAVQMTVERHLPHGTGEDPVPMVVVRLRDGDIDGVAVAAPRVAPWPDAERVTALLADLAELRARAGREAALREALWRIDGAASGGRVATARLDAVCEVLEEVRSLLD